MTVRSLDKLGQLLMSQVRDKSIRDWDKILDGRMKGDTASRVRSDIQKTGMDISAIMEMVVPRIVDTTIHHLLWMLEQDDSLELLVKTDNEITSHVREESDGLCGELYGREGWISRFSNERHEE